MAAQGESAVTGLFEPALRNFGNALEAGLKIQEEIARFWSDVLPQAGQRMQEWQKRSEAIVNDTIPAAQKSAETWMQLMEQSYRRGMDMFRKALDSASPARDAQSQTRELWEASAAMVRESAQAMARANLRLMELWSEMLRRNGAAVSAKE